MTQNYDTIYLSPHLDDGVLSCGGQIYRQTTAGNGVLIVTIMAGEPDTDVRSEFARYLHQSWGLTAEEVIAARRAEDVAACRRVGADFVHWPLPDCIYRLHPETGEPLYTSEEDLFGDVHPAESSLIDELAQRMAELRGPGRVIAPLTLGNHVDHQITRAAAERCFGDDLHYYEDYPYVQRHPDALDALIRPPAGWQSDTIPLDEAAITARIEASLAYASQIAMLFDDEATMVRKIQAQIRETGGERLWHRVRQHPRANGE